MSWNNMISDTWTDNNLESNVTILVKKPKSKLPSFYLPVGKQLLNFLLLNALKEDFLKRTVYLL